MNAFVLIFLFGTFSSLAQASSSHDQIVQQQMDCVSGYIKQGRSQETDPCYNDTASSKDILRPDPVVYFPSQEEQRAQTKIPKEKFVQETQEVIQETVKESEELPVEIQEEALPIKETVSILKTRTHTVDVGTEFNYYRYVEPDIDVFLTGPTAGFYGNYTYRPTKQNIWNNEFFNVYRMEGRFSKGDLKYQGSGINKGENHKTYEYRAMVGKDFILKDASRVTSYLGFGYRHLFDDNGGGRTSDGHLTYDRKSHYFYLPIGVTADIPTGKNTEVSLNLEYDHLIKGYQFSYLSDADHITTFPSTDLKNQQDKGFGIRSSIRFLKHYSSGDLYFEPFIRYWKIEDSDLKEGVFNGTPLVGLEPLNSTTEVGSKFGLQF